MSRAVIVPVRGPARHLADALESVLAQDPDEVIVVDDDAGPGLVVPAGARVVPSGSPGSGPAAARAAGLAATDADLIALADSDDVWLPGKLAVQLEALAAHPGAAVCFGRAEIVGPDDVPTGERWPELAAGLHPAESLRRVLFESNPIPAASPVIRRPALH